MPGTPHRAFEKQADQESNAHFKFAVPLELVFPCCMQEDFQPSRFWRIISSIWIGLAILLIIGGQTWWKDDLSGLGFLIYWGACFFSAVLAAACALLDLMTIKRETKIENRRLFHETIEQIQASAIQSKKTHSENDKSTTASES